MAENDGQEKSEQPSQKKLKEGREKGQVAKSIEINSLVIFTSGLMLIFLAQSHIGGNLALLSKKIFSSLDILEINRDSLKNYFFNSYGFYVITLGPLFAGLFIAAFVSNISQVGFKLSLKALAPKKEKFNPLKGFKRILFSSHSLTEVLKSLLKLFIIGLFTYYVLKDLVLSSTSLSDFSIDEILKFMLSAASSLLWKISIVYALIAAADFIYQKYKFKKDMMMTKQEVKEENKQSEGDPQIKSRIRKVQFSMANNRMMQNIPQADVVITNPTHYAIALKYDQLKNAAPRVLAKGVDEVALRIKKEAIRCEIPLHEDRELARALFKSCDVGDEIPSALFKAVAQVLAYVYRLKNIKKKKSIV